MNSYRKKERSGAVRIIKVLAMLLVLMLLMLTGCTPAGSGSSSGDGNGKGDTSEAAEASEDTAAPEKNGKVMILYTSDIHCGIDEGYGFAGLQAVRDSFEAKGYETILVDDGDAIQGNAYGMMTKGETIISLMNSMKYDVAIPGNHEFDYSPDRLLELAEIADFPYISCNFNKDGELIFKPYVIKEAAGMKIAFVGVTTPTTLRSATPEYFYDDEGNLLYNFKQGGNGEELYQAVQDAVDSARAEGADYVYVMAHLGMNNVDSPWTYADVLEHTNGIDVLLDGHSHDIEQVVMKNKDGDKVVRSACGTKMQAIGYSEISKDKGIVGTGIWDWGNNRTVPDLFGIDNDIEKEVDAVKAELNESLSEVIGTSTVDLTIFDPVERYENGDPIRMVRRADTNLGDFCADALRCEMDAQISFVNAGNIRADIKKGDVTYGNLLEVNPFNNEMCRVEITGQQIMDALEWGARSLPAENPGFLQVSGLTYEVYVNIPSPCIQNEEGMFAGVEGERRVRNVMVDGKPIDLNAIYTVAGNLYMMRQHGDGYTMFDNAVSVINNGKLDSEVLISYIRETLHGEIGAEYADPYGQGRIVIIE